MAHVLIALEPTTKEVSQGAHVRVIEHGESSGGPRVWSTPPRGLLVVEVFAHNRDERFAREVHTACMMARVQHEKIKIAQQREIERMEAVHRRKQDGGHFASFRWLVKERFGNVCVYCGKPEPRTVDHLHPRVHGGADTFDNLVPACVECNSLKGAMSVDTFLAMLEAKRPGLALQVLERAAEVLERAPPHRRYNRGL